MEEKYPVLYYELGNLSDKQVLDLADKLEKYFNRENVPFLLIPKQWELKWLSKEEVLKQINDMKEYVETWPE